MSQLTAPLDDVARHVLAEVRRRRQHKRQQLPAIRTDRSRRPAIATVFYLCPDEDVPSGGVRTIYRHVDILNAAGIPAFVLHQRPGFSCTWFSHHTQVRSVGQVELTDRDIIVVPEMYGPTLGSLPPGPRVVVFNQNAYNTFDGVPRVPARKGSPYMGIPGLCGIVTVSFDNVEYLRFAFPDLPVIRVRPGIDDRLFHPGPDLPDRRIAVMPRRRAHDLHQVLHLLTAHGSLEGWEVVPIEHSTEERTAELLRSCAFFFGFSWQEGFGLPPAEAMACGAYVVGFTGLGGQEYFLPEFSTPVEEGDVLAFARAADGLLRDYEEIPLPIREKALAASRRVLETYALDKQRRELVDFFSALVADR